MNCKKCGAPLPDDAVFCHLCGRKQIRDHRKAYGKRPTGTGSVYKARNPWPAEIPRGHTLVNGKKHRLRERQRGFPTKAAAMDYCHRFDEERQKKAVPTLEQLWQAWSTSDMKKLSASKQSAYTIAHARLLKTDIVFSQITDLRLSDLQTAMDSQCTSFYTARDFKNLLSKLYQRSMADQDVTINLARMLTLPDLEEEEPVPFNDLEQTKIWNAYSEGDMMAGYILLMIYTGMMPGELMSCRKSMICWDTMTIEGAGKKTEKRRETPIVFPAVIEPVLRQLVERTPGVKLLHMNKDYFYKEYHATLQRIGCRDLPPYSCRHTTGTALDRAKLSSTLIQKIMRHAKFSSTQRYIHKDTSDMRAGVNAIGRPSEAV